VGVDSPDFNLGVELKMRAAGIPVVQFVSPAIWAWRPGRIAKIRAAVDHMLLVFPFEEPIYAAAGIPATYVGHPLAGSIPMRPDTRAARHRLGLPSDGPVVGILPGSRESEVSRLGPVFFQAAAKLLQADSGVRCVVPVADPSLRLALDCLRAALPSGERLMLVDGRSHDVLEAADVVLLAAGTATLEAMLYKKPMVIAYKVPRLTERITLRQAIIPYIGLPNVLEGTYCVPEFLQEAVEPGRLAAALLRYLDRPAEAALLRERFEGQHERLRRDTAGLASQAIVDTLRAAPAGMRTGAVT
jgi:lipid-A-disaccharide synthase